MNDLENLIAWAKTQGFDPATNYLPPVVNGRLSANFTEAEFRCRCCGQLPRGGMSPALIVALQAIRDRYGVPVTVNSGYRCVVHNRAVGGSPNSQHLVGNAADFVVRGIPASRVFADLDPAHQGGLGRYNTFTHIDVRPNRVRW